MARLSLYLFGSYQITLEGKALSHPLPIKARALMAYLAIEKRPQGREKLAGLLWPEHSEVRARQSLSQALYEIRKLLWAGGGEPELILSNAQEVQLNPAVQVWVDVAEFSAVLQACEQRTYLSQTTQGDCYERLRQAVALYRGNFLADFSLSDVIPFDEWCTVQRERLHRQAMQVLDLLVSNLEGRGEIERALEIAWRQVEFDPLSEASHRQVVRLLAESGRRSEALAHFQAFRQYLFDSLMIAPDAETLEQIDKITRQAPPPEPPRGSKSRLPASLTPLIGRKAELSELVALLRKPACRLVTVFGPGGVGKTRLALEVAHQVEKDFADGVYFIALSAHQPNDPLWPELVEALHLPLRDKSEPEQQLKDYLFEKRLLLLLDSFETALKQSGWLADLLQHAPLLTVLTTSRSHLEISAEQVFPLGGMPVPKAGEIEHLEQYSAMQLLASFIRNRQPAFVYDHATQQAAAHICRLVQGLPLGLLLASAWVDYYSLEEIAGQIERSLDFLEVDWSDVPHRQRSLRATFDYSWKLLSPDEQRFFTALAVFSGGFTLPAVGPVTGQPVRLLRSLVDKNLVNRIPGGRYQIHDLVHQYAAGLFEGEQKLAEAVRTGHSHFYMEALSGWEKDLKSSRQREALEAMDQEVENLRLAWRRAIETQDWQWIAKGLEGMAWYVEMRLRFPEGERACRTALEQISPFSHSSLFSALTAWQARFLCRLGQVKRAGESLKTELERLGTLPEQTKEVRAGKAQILFELGELNTSTDREIASRYYRDSLMLYEELQDECRAVNALLSLGILTHHNGNFTEAKQLLSQALTYLRKIGDPSRLACTLRWLAFNEARLGKLTQAEQILRESLSLRQASGSSLDAALAKDDLGTLISWSGKFSEGSELLEQSLAVYQKLGYKSKEIWSHCMLGLQYLLQGKYQKSRTQAQATLQLAHPDEAVREIAIANYLLGGAALGEGDFPKAFDLLGESLRLYRQIDQMDELGWTLIAQSYAARALGWTKEAQQQLLEAAQIVTTLRGFSTATFFIAAAALFSMDQGNLEKALELQALTKRFPNISQARWFEDVVWHHISTATKNLTEEVISAAQQRGQQRDLFATVEELMGDISSQVSSSP